LIASQSNEVTERNEVNENQCTFCEGTDGSHTDDCRLNGPCIHDWIPEPLVVLMESCTKCKSKRPIESRELRIANLLSEAAHFITNKQSLHDALVQGAIEMQHRAQVLEERRIDAAKSLVINIEKE